MVHFYIDYDTLLNRFLETNNVFREYDFNFSILANRSKIYYFSIYFKCFNICAIPDDIILFDSNFKTTEEYIKQNKIITKIKKDLEKYNKLIIVCNNSYYKFLNNNFINISFMSYESFTKVVKQKEN